MPYEAHPAAALFPMMADEELQRLATDIKENGLHEAITLYHGQILDGRNRLAACQIAGVEPRFLDANGNIPSPTAYAVSRNLHRRHLKTSQRSAIAADVIPLLAEEAKARQLSWLKNQAHSSSSQKRDDEPMRSSEVAAEMLGVGKTSVQAAVRAKRDNPEGFEKVKRGELTVNAAAAGHTEQPKRGGNVAVDAGSERGQQRVEAQKRRMISALSAATGICSGLASADIQILKSACSKEEIELWAGKAREIAKSFRDFAALLERK